MSPVIKLATISIGVYTNIMDDDDKTTAVASLSVDRVPDWLYASEAIRLGHQLVKQGTRALERAKKRTARLKKWKKR